MYAMYVLLEPSWVKLSATLHVNSFEMHDSSSGVINDRQDRI